MHIINGDLGTSFLYFLVEPSKVAKGMIVRLFLIDSLQCSYKLKNSVTLEKWQVVNLKGFTNFCPHPHPPFSLFYKQEDPSIFFDKLIYKIISPWKTLKKIRIKIKESTNQKKLHIRFFLAWLAVSHSTLSKQSRKASIAKLI